MTDRKMPMRLDEILVFEGLVKEEQIKEVLEYQKKHGGKIGSHLLRFRYVDEAGLLKALEKQFNCRGVHLSELTIPSDIIKMVDGRYANSRYIIPFEYDKNNNVLKIACENPNDEKLISELEYISEGRTIHLYVCLEISIRHALAKYYPPIDNDSNRQIDSGSDQNFSSATTVIPDMAKQDRKKESSKSKKKYRASILLVTDEIDNDFYLQEILTNENYEVIVCESAKDALELIGSKSFNTLFIRDTISGDYLDLIDRLRKISPKTVVHYYDSLADFVIGSSGSFGGLDLLTQNFDLLTSLLSKDSELKTNHAGRVGTYVKRLCEKIGLHEKESQFIVSAAYLHDISGFYYGDAKDIEDNSEKIKRTVKLLNSLGFPPLVIGVLKSMYVDLKGKYKNRLPIEKLGGNIVTICDLFCESIPIDGKITIDTFEQIKEKINDLSGKLFLSEVVDAFLSMIREQVLNVETVSRYNQVMIFSRDENEIEKIDKRLKNEGYRTIIPTSTERMLDLFHRSKPNFLILSCLKDAKEVNEFIRTLPLAVSDLKTIPTLLMTDAKIVSKVTPLLEQGIEDIIATDEGLDLLVVKIKKARDRIEAKETGKIKVILQTGTRGTLEDMNLIDLLQALGPSQKTARLTISSGDNQLVLYLLNGSIKFAITADNVGVDAVYEGIKWKSGRWQVLNLTEEDIPEHNIQLSNDAILMEGCRLLDEENISDANDKNRINV